MLKPVTVAVILGVLSGQGSQAIDCCDSYTDVLGDYHPSELCLGYCCWTIGVVYKGCCSNKLRWIPSTENMNLECLDHWLNEHGLWYRVGSALIIVGAFGCLSDFCYCFIRILRHWL